MLTPRNRARLKKWTPDDISREARIAPDDLNAKLLERATPKLRDMLAAQEGGAPQERATAQEDVVPEEGTGEA